MNHRPLLAFILGLAAGIFLFSEWQFSIVVFALVAVTALGCLFLSKRHLIFLAGIVLLGASVGGLRACWYTIVPPSNISHFTKGELDRGPYVTLVGTVASEPNVAHDRETFYLSVDTLKDSGTDWKVTGQTYVSIPQSQTDPAEYGDQIAVTGFLAKPRSVTNLGGFDWAGYLERRGVRSVLSAYAPPHRDTVGGSGILRWSSALREDIQSKSNQYLPSSEAAVLTGILVGAGNAIPGDLRADFVHTGTVHILASAGLHVGVLLLCILALARWAGAPRKVGAALGIALLIVFLFAAGGRPAVVRASIVGIVWLVGKLLEREPDFLTSLGVSAGIILWFQPTALLEPGFELSFTTVGILCAALPGWKRLMDKYFDIAKYKGTKREAVSWTMDLIGVAIFAQLGSLPIVALNYNEVSVYGTLANIIVVPLVFLIIPLGFAAVSAPGLISAGLFKVSGFLVVCVDAIVRFFSNLPLSYVAVTTPSDALVALYYAVLLAAIYWLDKKTQKAS